MCMSVGDILYKPTPRRRIGDTFEKLQDRWTDAKHCDGSTMRLSPTESRGQLSHITSQITSQFRMHQTEQGRVYR